MNYASMSTDLIGVHWVNAWRDRGVITGCFGLPSRESMLKELREMGLGADTYAPPLIPVRPWWQSWGVIGVVALTVGLLLWQPTKMRPNRQRRKLRRNIGGERRKRENACGRSKEGHDFQYEGQYGAKGRTVLTYSCAKCGKTKSRYNDSRSWIKKNGRTSRRFRKNSVKKDIAELISKAQAAGWTVEYTNSGHLKFKPADRTKQIVIVGGTPSDHRALKNIKSMLRRSGLAVNAKARTVRCEACSGSGDAPGTWPIEACPVCGGEGKRPETPEERLLREKRNARGRARGDAMRSLGMRRTKGGGWE